MPFRSGASLGVPEPSPPEAAVPLDTVLARHRDQAVSVPFDAMLDGRWVTVTAVLSRTAVYGPVGGRELARHERFFVVASALTWRSISTTHRRARERGLYLSRFRSGRKAS